MDDRHERIRELFLGALELPADQRDGFLDDGCGGEADLRAEVQMLIAADEQASEVTRRASTISVVPRFPPGKELAGRFRVVRFIAAGGMGDVYEVEDLELRERVALKTVRPEVVGDPHSLSRFKREIQYAKRVTHPNVCRIHDLGSHREGEVEIAFLTMQLLDGETLSAHLRLAGRMTAKEALPLATQMAEALSAAHDAGIIHRDFKTSNVMLVGSGAARRAVVTDFGLAHSSAPAGDCTLTESGKLVGTPAYMAPEQVMHGVLTPATDVYALGLVMYEMVTGHRPFQGDTPIDMALKRLAEAPLSPSVYAPDLDKRWEGVILRCLEREPARRFQTASEVARALTASSASSQTRTLTRQHAFHFSRRSWVAICSLVFTVAGVGFLGWPLWRPPLSPRRFIPVTNQPGEQLFPTLSPDATHVAYAWEKDGDSDIYVQAVGGGQPVDITPDCKSMDSEPAWSPDGQRIAYRCERDGGGISITAADGSWNRRLTSIGHQPSWSPDGTRLVVATERVADLSGLTAIVSPLSIVDVKDGSVHPLLKGDGFQPSWSPHGKRIAFWTHIEGRRSIKTAAVGSGALSEVVSDNHMNWNPVWSSDGRWIYFLSDRGGSMNLWRIHVDETSGERNGDPEPVILPATYVQHLSISRDGQSIAYVQRTLLANLFRVAFDSGLGKIGIPTQLTFGMRFDSMPGLSADGAMLAFTSGLGKPDQIYIMPSTVAGRLRQITDNTDESVRFMEPRWSPDGNRIAFQSNLPSDTKRLNQIWSIRPDGSDLTQLTHLGQHAISPVWKPDGTELAYSVVGGHSWFLRIATMRAEEFVAPPNRSMQFIAKSWSADGRRIAGTIHRPDGASAGIVVYTPSDRRYEGITSFGSAPVWLKDGVRLLFRRGVSIYLADTRTHLSVPLTLPSSLHPSDTFAVSSDDRWLFVSSSTEQANVWIARNMH